MTRKPSRALGAFRQGVLQNGIPWSCWHHEGDTVLSQQVWIAAGSAHESPEERGVAHFVEHLLFRGSANCPDGALDARAEEAGAQINAFTWLDYTTYTATFAPEATELLCALEADRIFQPLLGDKTAEEEREIIAQERRSEVESSEEALLQEALLECAFGTHPYGCPTLGYADDIARLNATRARRWHARTHHPSRMHIVAAGAVDVDAWVRHLEQSFGQARMGPVTALDLPPVRRPAGTVTTTRRAVPLDQLHVALPVGDAAARERASALTLCELLAGAASSPLAALLERDAAVAQELQLDVLETRGDSVALLQVSLRPGHAPQEALRLFDDLLSALETSDLDAHLERVRSRWADDHFGSWQCTETRATHLGEAATLLGDPSYALRRPFVPEETTVEDLRTQLRSWRQASGRHVVHVHADAGAT